MTQLSYADSLEFLLDRAKALGASGCDAGIGRSEGVSVAIRNGELESIERDESASISLRCLDGQRQAHVSGSDTSRDGLERLVDRCVAMAKAAPEDPWCGITPESDLASDIPDIDLLGDDPVAPEILEAEAIEAEAAARAVAGVKDVPSCSSGCTFSEGWVAASNGFRAYRKDSYSGIGLAAIAEQDGVMERDYDSWTIRRRVNRPSSQEIGHSAGTRAIARLGARKIESQKAAVFFDRRLSASLIGAFTSAISGSAIARGTSFLKDHLGKQVFGSNINIIDDPFRPLGMGSRAFDGEGRAVRRSSIIENGVLSEWLLNGPAARQLGLTPNGFASFGFGDPPGISTSNLYMEAGSEAPEALLKSVDKALWITEMFGPSINPNTGDYSVGVAGQWVENGEIQHAVSEVTVADNLIEMFARLVPANDLEFRGSTNAPSLMIDGMTLAGL